MSAGKAPGGTDPPEGYRTVRTLGRGGFAEVHEVEEIATGRRLAWKRIPLEDPGRAERELSVLAAVAHPGVLACLLVGSTPGMAWVLMELAEGTLADWLESGTPTDPAWELLVQAGRGLAHLHRNGLVHRDVKPANVFRTPTGGKIGDLGLVRGGDLETLTRTGMVLGTPAYMAPEQARGERAGTSADVFGLAACFYHVLEGRPPFQGSVRDALVKAARGEVPLLSARAAGRLAPEVRKALEAALDPSPEARPGNLEAWLETLATPPSERDGRRTTLQVQAGSPAPTPDPPVADPDDTKVLAGPPAPASRLPPEAVPVRTMRVPSGRGPLVAAALMVGVLALARPARPPDPPSAPRAEDAGPTMPDGAPEAPPGSSQVLAPDGDPVEVPYRVRRDLDLRWSEAGKPPPGPRFTGPLRPIAAALVDLFDRETALVERISTPDASDELPEPLRQDRSRGVLSLLDRHDRHDTAVEVVRAWSVSQDPAIAAGTREVLEPIEDSLLRVVDAFAAVRARAESDLGAHLAALGISWSRLPRAGSRNPGALARRLRGVAGTPAGDALACLGLVTLGRAGPTSTETLSETVEICRRAAEADFEAKDPAATWRVLAGLRGWILPGERAERTAGTDAASSDRFARGLEIAGRLPEPDRVRALAILARGLVASGPDPAHLDLAVKISRQGRWLERMVQFQVGSVDTIHDLRRLARLLESHGLGPSLGGLEPPMGAIHREASGILAAPPGPTQETLKGWPAAAYLAIRDLGWSLEVRREPAEGEETARESPGFDPGRGPDWNPRPLPRIALERALGALSALSGSDPVRTPEFLVGLREALEDWRSADRGPAWSSTGRPPPLGADPTWDRHLECILAEAASRPADAGPREERSRRVRKACLEPALGRPWPMAPGAPLTLARSATVALLRAGSLTSTPEDATRWIPELLDRVEASLDRGGKVLQVLARTLSEAPVVDALPAELRTRLREVLADLPLPQQENPKIAALLARLAG